MTFSADNRTVIRYVSISIALGAAIGIIACLVSSDSSIGHTSSKFAGQMRVPHVPRGPLNRGLVRPSMLGGLPKPIPGLAGLPKVHDSVPARHGARNAQHGKSIVDVSPSRSSELKMSATPNAPPVYDGKYAEELMATAAAMVKPGKGLLACDESTGTIGTRLESIGLENTEKNRQEWRNLLFTAPGIGEYISGAILFEETLYQNDPAGKPFVDVLKKEGIIPGIKVDKGLRPLVGGGDGENWCTGLDDLAERTAKYYEQGARFAKWRTALKIDVEAGLPTDLAIDVAAQDLARYARICQENGLVPIVEPEILIDGSHDITTTCRIQERVLSTVYQKLHDNGVLMEGSLLKPSMTVPGVQAADKSDPSTIAKLTVQTLDRCLPSSMPGVTFLSGGISEEDSSIYLNEINKAGKKGAFATTFSYSRALQSSCIKMWGGKKENYEKAQQQLLARAKANSEASVGKYVPGSQPSDEESLFVQNYVY